MFLRPGGLGGTAGRLVVGRREQPARGGVAALDRFASALGRHRSFGGRRNGLGRLGPPFALRREQIGAARQRIVRHRRTGGGRGRRIRRPVRRRRGVERPARPGRHLARPVLAGNPILAGPVLAGNPILAGPVLAGNPILAGPRLFGKSVLAGPQVFGGPVVARADLLGGPVVPRPSLFHGTVGPDRRRGAAGCRAGIDHRRSLGAGLGRAVTIAGRRQVPVYGGTAVGGPSAVRSRSGPPVVWWHGFMLGASGVRRLATG
ncbi:hypothetical protein OG792_24610 [Micromonospora sp. NBC_01699]|uniref:hypothetical protein n=1 Tax=Micromonospora sp. NBC_01699 TaxID=2975984 RepID=UPI002E2B0950|nr:hypothetical protein [Micromonospora sp. NBC_01699]